MTDYDLEQPHAGPSRRQEPISGEDAADEASIASILVAKRARTLVRLQDSYGQEESALGGQDDDDDDDASSEHFSQAHSRTPGSPRSLDSPLTPFSEKISLLGHPADRKRGRAPRWLRNVAVGLATSRKSPLRFTCKRRYLAYLAALLSLGSLCYLLASYSHPAPREFPISQTAAEVTATDPADKLGAVIANVFGSTTATSTSPPVAVPTGPRPASYHAPASDPIPFIIPPPQDRRKVEPLEADSPLRSDRSALDAWIAQGTLPRGVSWPRNHPSRRHDVVFAHVNGSDWEHARMVEQYYNVQGKGAIDEKWRGKTDPAKAKRAVALAELWAKPDASRHRFREMDELRYAVRSAFYNLQDLSTIHIVTPSFSPPRPYDLPGSFDGHVGAPKEWEAPHRKHDAFLGEDGRIQWGQVPQWLQTASDRTSKGKSLRIHHDWQIWTPNWLYDHSSAESGGNAWRPSLLAEWRRQVLPTFNSMAMESNLGHEGLDGLAETFVYANDDMFFGAKSSLFDFATPIYGPVLRLDNNLQVRGKKIAGPGDQGEWPSLQRSAWLLDQRFGKRTRAYTVHEPKVFNSKLLREMRMMWAEQWRQTAEDRFRSEEVDRSGANTPFLMAHFLIERHREALLWSFLVAKMDENANGRIDFTEFTKHLLQPLGAADAVTSFADLNPLDQRLTVGARFPHRSTMASDAHLHTLREHSFAPKSGGISKSRYDFVSSDGYPFLTLHPFMQAKAPLRPAGGGRASGVSQVASEPWPRYHPRQGKTKDSDSRYRMSQPACQLHLAHCLTGIDRIDDENGGSVDSNELFKKIAFERGDTCGDCLIVHLLGQSGDKGFEAFLPGAEQHFPDVTLRDFHHQQQEPHLPLTPTWSSSNRQGGMLETPWPEDRADFSLAHLASTLSWSSGSLRSFTQRLIRRYSYALSSAPIVFERLESPKRVESVFAHMDSAQELFICLNDDYKDSDAGRIKQAFTAWAQRQWSSKSPWEE